MTELTDRNLPGSLLDGVLTAALSGSLLNSFDPVAGVLGAVSGISPATGQPTSTVGSVIRVSAPPARAAELPVAERPVVTAPEKLKGEVEGIGTVRLGGMMEGLFLVSAERASIPTTAGAAMLPPAASAGSGEAGAAPATRIRVEAAPLLGALPNGGAAVAAAPRAASPSAPASTPITSTEYAPELPPNTAPVAADDAASCYEDDYVLIDVMSNDSDADADPIRIDTWDLEAANGTVTQEPDGRLKYDPIPNFHGTETITYSVTDGRDASTPATVTITVEPLNDAPRAFEDAITFGFNPQVSVYSSAGFVLGSSGQSVLWNDDDVEDDTLSADLVSQPSYGTVQLEPDGTFTYAPPATAAADLANSPHYVYTSFTYEADDGNGGTSGPTAVHLWLKGPLGPHETDDIPWWSATAPIAEDDRFAIGDQVLSGEVASNDVGGSVWVLTGHPGSGLVMSFNTGGAFVYDPGVDRNDADIGYVTVSGEGRFSNGAQAKGVKVDLVIWRGQSGNSVRDADEDAIGSFTVANRNDTDGNGVADYKQESSVLGGVPETSVGIDEVDLMKVHVGKPTGFGATDPNETMTLTVGGGDASFFQSSTREGKLGASLKISPSLFVGPNNQPLDHLIYWVEIAAPSKSLRDVELELKYKTESDKAKATGIWVDFAEGGFHASGKTAGADADYIFYVGGFNRMAQLAGFELGQPPMLVRDITLDGKSAKQFYLINAIEFEFSVVPAGVEIEKDIRFDVTRSMQRRYWAQSIGGKLTEVPTGYRTYPIFVERANDDGHAFDEDNRPKNSHIYSFDSPGYNDKVAVGLPLHTGLARIVTRMNAVEFVRVNLGASGFQDDLIYQTQGNPEQITNPAPIQGSRGSELVRWRTWADFAWSGLTWERTPNVPGAEYNSMTRQNQDTDLYNPLI